jgi:SPP1 gp7 family putative phage head morphogenesis protein
MFDSVFSPNPSAIFRAKTPDYVKPKSIKINLDRLENGGANTLTDAFSRVVSKALKDLDGAIKTKDSKAIENYQAVLIPELTKSIYGMWLGGWNIGRKHGDNEIKSQQKKGTNTANFDEDLLDAELASIENVPAQNAIANRSKTLASDISSTQWGKIRGHILSAIQPQSETGEPISRSELLKRINSELGDRGFKNRAEKIARTELTFAYNAGRLQTYKDSGLVSHVVFLSILDDRRCQVCEGRHGMMIDLNDIETVSANTPPMHVNCRCVLSPRLATPDNQQELDDQTQDSKKRRLFEAPPKWLAAGILAAILLSQKKVRVPGSGVATPGISIPSPVREVVERGLVDVALATQIQKIAKATGEVQTAEQIRQRRKNQTESLPDQGVIEIQPRLVLNGVELNSATPEQIREGLKEFLPKKQLDDLINYLQENKISSIDDLLEVKGISRKSKAFKILQGLADKDKLSIELEKLTSPSELWLKNLGFSRSESKAIFDELKNKPSESWSDLKRRLKKRGISGDRIQRAIDKLKSIEAQEKRQVVGLDNSVPMVPDVTLDSPEIAVGKLIKQREIGLQRRREALQEIKDLGIELAKIRSDEKRFNVRLRRMNKRNPKEFVSPEEIRIKEIRYARVQAKIEQAQKKANAIGLQLERANLALNQLDIPNLTPAAKLRNQAVQNLGDEGSTLLDATNSLKAQISNEIDSQMSKGFIPPNKKIAGLEQANNRAKLITEPVSNLIEKTNLEDLRSKLTALQSHYQNLLDPLYPENFFGRDIQNDLTSLRAELKRVKTEIDDAVSLLKRTDQTLTATTNQTESILGKMGYLKTGAQLEKQAKELESQILNWENRVKKTRNYEQTYEPFSQIERQQPLDKLIQDATDIKTQVPKFKKELESRFRPGLNNAKSTISDIAIQTKKLEQLQKEIDGILTDTSKLPITKAQIPSSDVGTYNATVELRKISREITEEVKRLKALAGASRVNLDESLKSQNKTYQQYEKQRFGDEQTPSWEKNLSPMVESRITQVEDAVKKLEAIGQDWNIGFLVDLGQKIDDGVDATGKALKVRRWLDANGLSPEDLTLSPGTGRKVGYEAIRQLADETLRQYNIVQSNIRSIKKDTQFKVFTENGLIEEDKFLKWAEDQAAYWQNQVKTSTSDNWQGSSYERVDKLWKSLDGKKASDVKVRESIKPDDVQGQLRKTIGKYQDWQRKYTVLKEQGEVTGNGIRSLNDAQKKLLNEQNILLEQLNRYNLDSSNLIRDNADNTMQIWEKVRQDAGKPVFFDVKGKAIERGELFKQLDEIENKLKQSLNMREIKIEPLTYQADKASLMIKDRNILNQALTELEPKITEIQQQIQQLATAGKGTKKLETQLNKLQLEKQIKQQQLGEVIQDIRDLRLPPLQNEKIQILKGQIGETQKQLTGIKSEIATLRREITALKEQPLDGSASGIKRQNRLNALEGSITRKNQDLFKVVGVLNDQRGELGRLRAGS